MGDIFLQLFLIVNVFGIGVLTAIGVRHAYLHFHPEKHEEKHRVPGLPPAVKEKLLHAATAKFQAVLDFSAGELREDLQATSGQLNKKLESLGGDIVATEMERYQSSLEHLRKETEAAISEAQKEITKHEKELKDKLTEHEIKLKVRLTKEVNSEKAKLVEQIDTKLGDAAVSFIIETLQHNVDLGAQTKYLTEILEEHKEDFKREVDDGTPIAK